MPETRAYKLNEQRQPGSRPGTLIYHYYGPDGILTSQEVTEELFDALYAARNITTSGTSSLLRTTTSFAPARSKTSPTRR